jgi:hypothetical protein
MPYPMRSARPVWPSCARFADIDPDGSQAAFLTGLAYLSNLIPDQRRAKNAGLWGRKWKANACRLRTGCSTCTASPQAALGIPPCLRSTQFGGMWGCPLGCCEACHGCREASGHAEERTTPRGRAACGSPAHQPMAEGLHARPDRQSRARAGLPGPCHGWVPLARISLLAWSRAIPPLSARRRCACPYGT